MADAASPPRVVLDTNVCLDLFVFGDARLQPLHEALRAGRVQAVTRADCREEWLEVLGYPRLGLDASRRQQAAQDYDACMSRLAASSADPTGVVLPRCADRDDQKFLELAAETAASILLTRDRELLRLARRTAAWLAILTPQDWCQAATIGHARRA